VRQDLLQTALAQRLQQAQSLVSEVAADEPVLQRCDDPEEVLRVVMVRLFPKMQAQKAKPEEVTQYFDNLTLLMRSAMGKDWRYLDAWNNAFEVVQPQMGNLPPDRVSQFLSQYAFLLRSHLQNA
jgi:hypothetical protein